MSKLGVHLIRVKPGHKCFNHDPGIIFLCVVNAGLSLIEEQHFKGARCHVNCLYISRQGDTFFVTLKVHVRGISGHISE